MNLQGKKILVIGGAGFIGSHVVDHLLKTNVSQIIIYDNFSRGKYENIEEVLKDSRVSVFRDGGDILHKETLDQAMKGIDGIFHLAAVWILQCLEYPELAFDVNIRGTFNVIQAAMQNKVKRIIFSSSASVYGDALEAPMTEAHPYNNYTFYGATKIAGEHMLKSLGFQCGFEWVGLRYMNVYGPRQDYKGAYTAVMHRVLDRIQDQKPPIIHGDGSQTYDFVDVDDVARANILAMESEVSGQCFNIGRGIGTTLNELVELILTLKKSKFEPIYEGNLLTLVTKRIGCPKQAEQKLGFKWRIDLAEGMKRLIEWRESAMINNKQTHALIAPYLTP